VRWGFEFNVKRLPSILNPTTTVQERVLREPVLLVAAAEQTAMWERVLRLVAAPCRVVTYTGDSNSRGIARAVDWAVGGDTVDVLLTTSDVVVEDAALLQQQTWGMGVLDARSDDTTGLLNEQCTATLEALRLSFRLLLTPSDSSSSPEDAAVASSSPKPPTNPVWRLLAADTAVDGRPLHHMQQAGAGCPGSPQALRTLDWMPGDPSQQGQTMPKPRSRKGRRGTE
jgi:hypothetical protein